jgi:hypothetical protein
MYDMKEMEKRNTTIMLGVLFSSMILLGSLPTIAFAQIDNSGSTDNSGSSGSGSADNSGSSSQAAPTCSDGSQPDSNGNCQPSIHDQICNAYHSGAAGALAVLLPAAHILSGGTTALIMAAAALYCGA